MSTEKYPGGVERVAIVGVGAVGATAAYAMVQAGSASEILLVDRNRALAEGEVMDLQHCLPFTHHASLGVRDVDGVEQCDLVIVTAGVGQKPGESRLDLVQRNVAVFDSFMPTLARRNPDAHFMIVTNPVDVMTRVALGMTGLPPRQVFGSGTVLDSARFRTLISQHVGVQTGHIHAYVIGEHGDSEVIVWSRAMIGPFHVSEYCELHGITMSPEDTERIERNVRTAAYQIIERKGATHFAIGLAATRVTEALSQQEDSIFTVSRQCEGIYGLDDVCLSVPTLVNREGAVRACEIALSPGERTAFMRSAEVLDGVYQQLGLSN
ncbi:MAG: L-lactate dehydrogenase [bacterium]|nr:L-lactate dehydrogenase [bacterium]